MGAAAAAAMRITPEVYTDAAGLLLVWAVAGRQIRRRRHYPQPAGPPA